MNDGKEQEKLLSFDGVLLDLHKISQQGSLKLTWEDGREVYCDGTNSEFFCNLFIQFPSLYTTKILNPKKNP